MWNSSALKNKLPSNPNQRSGAIVNRATLLEDLHAALETVLHQMYDPLPPKPKKPSRITLGAV
jgi:hypothetical protein